MRDEEDVAAVLAERQARIAAATAMLRADLDLLTEIMARMEATAARLRAEVRAWGDDAMAAERGIDNDE